MNWRINLTLPIVDHPTHPKVHDAGYIYIRRRIDLPFAPNTGLHLDFGWDECEIEHAVWEHRENEFRVECMYMRGTAFEVARDMIQVGWQFMDVADIPAWHKPDQGTIIKELTIAENERQANETRNRE